MTNKTTIQLGQLVSLFYNLQKAFNHFLLKIHKVDELRDSKVVRYDLLRPYKSAIRGMKPFTSVDLPEYARQSEMLLDIASTIESCFPTTNCSGSFGATIHKEILESNKKILDSKEYRYLQSTIQNFVRVYVNHKNATKLVETTEKLRKETIVYDANLWEDTPKNSHRKRLKVASDEVILEMVKLVNLSSYKHFKLPSLVNVLQVQQQVCFGNDELIKRIYGDYQKALAYFFDELTAAVNGICGDKPIPDEIRTTICSELFELHDSFVLLCLQMKSSIAANPTEV